MVLYLSSNSNNFEVMPLDVKLVGVEVRLWGENLSWTSTESRVSWLSIVA